MSITRSQLAQALAGSLLIALLSSISGCSSSSGDVVRFLIRIQNNGADAIPTSLGTNVPAVFAPGAAAVHFPGVNPFFENGGVASPGLEIMAEDGGGMLLAAEADAVNGVRSTVAFGIPEGAEAPGPLTPGNAYVFEVEARFGEQLSLATMFVQSNDLFVAPAPDGLPLFDDEGNPRSGEIVGENVLWDAGTEVNEEPGVGPNQAPRQAGPDTGEVENGVVRLLDENDFPLPPLANYLSITITPMQ